MHPIKHHLDNKVDKRYSVNLEWAGEANKQWIARFCGEWVGKGRDKQEAIELAQEHYDNNKINGAKNEQRTI